MGYKHLLIKKCFKLSLKNNSLCIQKEENEDTVVIPLEDISDILIEDPKTILTARLLTECSKNGITCYLCDEKYNPNTQIVPYNVHYNHLGVFRKQMSLPNEIKQKLWQKIVASKISNQCLVESFTMNDERIIDMLSNYSKSVKINDKDNREGISSKVYFTSLFGDDFIRFGNSPISNALNYGYTIICGAIIRCLTLYGLNTYIGIWHSSDQNAFNLASDFIEPFRPIVDYYCYWNIDKIEFPLSSDNRKELIMLLNHKIRINNKLCTIDYAIETVAKSYLKVLDTKNENDLILPIIESIDFTNGEFI
ncbi:MAG: type II CRISPR-associated endonuclease Cas1 [Bacilli bacterium]|nr:type II CRISPR-associated endonuclease Cas1 [Bacilli bacterium]